MKKRKGRLERKKKQKMEGAEKRNQKEERMKKGNEKKTKRQTQFPLSPTEGTKAIGDSSESFGESRKYASKMGGARG